MDNTKKKKPTRKDIVEKRIVDSLKTVQNPVRNALLIALAWEVVVIIIAIIYHFTGGQSFARNFNTAFIVGVAISVIWIFLKWGLFEGFRLKFRNWSNKKIVKRIEVDQKKVLLTLPQHRALSKERSWWGIWALLGVNLVGFAATLAFVI